MMKLTRQNRLSAMRIALLAACGAALCLPLAAQDTGAPPPPPQAGPMGGRGAEMQEKQLEHMTKHLQLTPDQVTQIKAIQADGMQKMMALRNDTASVGPDRRAKAMAVRQDQTSKIRAVLTDDQKVKFDAMREKEEEHREHRGGGDGSMPPPPPSN